MAKRFAVDVKWDSRKKRYVARCKDIPAIVAYGLTIQEAQQSMKEAIAEHLYGEQSR